MARPSLRISFDPNIPVLPGGANGAVGGLVGALDSLDMSTAGVSLSAPFTPEGLSMMVEIAWTGTPVGVFVLQNRNGPLGAWTDAPAGTYSTAVGAPAGAAGGTQFFVNQPFTCAGLMRLKYTRTSGSGTGNATFAEL
jgi:hypothetical protein